MELSVEVIDGFRKVARNLANDVIIHIPAPPDEHYVHHIHGKAHHRTTHHNNDFHVHPLGINLPDYKIKSDGWLDTYCGSTYAKIAFTDIRMRKITALKFSDPAKTDGHVTPVVVKSWTNAGDTKQKYEWKHTKSKSKSETYTSSTELGVEIAYALRTKVGGGVEGIGEAEIESEWSFKSNFTQRFEKSKTTTTTEEDSETLKFDVPSMTMTSLIRNKTMSDWHQTVTTTGVLDARIVIVSDNDFSFGFDSLAQLEDYIRGGGASKNKLTDNYFRQRHHQNYVIDLSSLHMTVETPFTYRDVSVSDIIRKDQPIEKAA